MSIPLAGWKMKHGVIHSALFESNSIVDGWLTSGLYRGCGHEEKAAEVCSGWARADLVERIACSLLARAGYDVDALEGALCDAAPQAELDTVIAWERAGPTLKPGIEIIDAGDGGRGCGQHGEECGEPECAPF